MQSVQIDFELVFWQKISGFETHDFYEMLNVSTTFRFWGNHNIWDFP